MALRTMPRTLWFLIAALCILLVDSIIVQLVPAEDRLLSYAVLFDFMIVLPFLYWLFVLRNTGKSLRRILSIAVAGGVLAWLVLPAEATGNLYRLLLPLEVVLIPAELAVLAFEARLVYRVWRRYREASRHTPQAGEALRTAIKESAGTGKLGSLLLHDLTMSYYLLFSWGRRKAAAPESAIREYTYHRSSNRILYAALVTKIIVFEAVALHFLLQMWSPLAAWIVTIGDLWILAFVWADARGAALRPIQLDQSRGLLKLRYGLQIQADLPLDRIDQLSHASEFHPDPSERKHAITPLLGAPNVRIVLSEPTEVEGLLFMPRQVSLLYLTVDQPAAFVQDIRQLKEERLG